MRNRDDVVKAWTTQYAANAELSYPPEALIRLLKGGPYPRQSMPKPQPGQSILDIGCGDGRNFVLFDQLDLEAHGTEISTEICAATADRIGKVNNIIRPGICSYLPFRNDLFDYVCAWNSCYYMGLGSGKFEDHVAEMHRVMKPDGWLICSVPTSYCFIFDHIAETDRAGYVEIVDEYFHLRQGEVMRRFADQNDVRLAFSSHFHRFSFSTVDIDQFGVRYSWHIFTAQKKSPHP